MSEAKGDVIAVVHTIFDFVEFVFPRPAIGYVGGFEHCAILLDHSVFISAASLFASWLLFFSSLRKRRGFMMLLITKCPPATRPA